MSLDKVLRLAQPAAPATDASELVRAAAEDLERIAALLALASDDDDDEDEDPDGDGDDDSKPSTDSDHDFWTKGGKKKKPLPKKGKGEKVKASRALVLEAMVALSQVHGGEQVTLSVLTAAERRKPSAHTIAGSEDFPIPDEAHLSAAVREYHAGNLAGHSASEVAAHIRSRAKALGKTVELTGPTPGEQVLALAKASQMVAMEHAPMTGEHDHPHRVAQVHSHRHTHNGDSRHACGDAGYGGY